MSSVIVERPSQFRIGKVFSDSFAVFGRNIALCIGLAALLSGLPALLIQLLNFQALESATTGPQTPTVAIITTIVAVLVSMVLSSLLQASMVRATIEDMNGRRPTFSDSLKTALSLVLPAIGIAILVTLGGGLGMILLIVPGVLLFLNWCVAVPVLVQERLGVLGSMKRSRALTRGSRWSLFGLFLIVGIASIALQLALAPVIALFGLIAGVFASAIVTSFWSIFMAIVIAVSYVELRLTKEGTNVGELAEIFS